MNKFGIALEEREWLAVYNTVKQYIEKRNKVLSDYSAHSSTTALENAEYEMRSMLSRLGIINK